MLIHVLLATVFAIIAIFGTVVLFMRERNKRITLAKETDVETPIMEKEQNLSKTNLSQYKILDAKSTAATLYSSMCQNEDLEGSAQKMKQYYSNQFNFN
jgi:hypothetical protein